MRQKTFIDKDVDYAKQLCIQNMCDILDMIKWNDEHNINVFRLSSNIFPHISSTSITNDSKSLGISNFKEYQSLEWAKDYLFNVGEVARLYNQRLTFHPGQYNQIASPTQEVFESTCLDLSLHAKQFDYMKMDKHSVMVIHGGGMYNNKGETLDRWRQQFQKLPEHVKPRIVLENCEKCYCIEDILPVCQSLGIPCVYDTHHYTCYSQLHPNETQQEIEVLIPKILDTWRVRCIKPKFHISEQGKGRVGHHSDYVEVIPEHLLEIPDKYNTPIDIMIEAKKKELAIFRLYEKYDYLPNV